MSYFSTSFDYFTNASQGALSALDWSNIANVLGSGGNASVNLSTSPASERLILDTPLSAAEIPGGLPLIASVTPVGFDIQLYHRRQGNPGSAGTGRDVEFQLQNGTNLSNQFSLSETDDAFELLEVGGDLSFWGLTEAQAEDIMDGTSGFYLRTQGFSINGSESYYLAWVKLSIRYEYTGSGIALPRLF